MFATSLEGNGNNFTSSFNQNVLGLRKGQIGSVLPSWCLYGVLRLHHSCAREETNRNARQPNRNSLTPPSHSRSTSQAAFEAQREALTAETARNRTSNDRFTAKTDGVEDSLKRSTYGLVQLSDFKETREKLEENARRDAEGGTSKKCV